LHIWDGTLFQLFCSFCEGAEESAITPFVSRIAQDLGPFLLVTTEDTLSLVLETMSVVLDVNKGQWLTADLANSLVLAVLEVWAKNNKGHSHVPSTLG
jgi:hypothetical protein